ncbi:hypothetical protein DJ568_02930 [Mucilaginibacter hurinus]|uniref:Signal transduction histidine kinase internal region domain-containing protein n=1 Tax=Mucilaginibacter hurinus TaxID=2201324 RepID=A0A367GUS2_9SPHI|nr:histidine kinase [Mucilaginibacter hurinus]RCH56825.1 hypothetical protein DJ568_02930 [Mucilaginibacter hurinus]
MLLKRTILFRHILVWAIYITYELALIDVSAGLNAPVLQYVTFYTANIVLFYFNAHVLLDYAFFRTQRPYLTAILLIILEIVVYLGIKILLDGLFKGKLMIEFTYTAVNKQIWLSNIFREIFLIGFSIAYWSMLYMIRFRDKNHAMEKEQLRHEARTLELENKYITAENAYLQNQISPHLLFNTLNFLYSTIQRVSDRAGKGVMLLSEIMRYSLISSADQRLVTLGDEVAQLNNLIELTSLRYRGDLHLRLVCEGDTGTVVILPLLLVTLVENMLKHGELGVPGQPGVFSLAVDAGTLSVRTWNRKRKSNPHPKSGIGLSNVRKRLNNYYPDRFTFDILENEEEFTCLLTLRL